MSKYILEEIGVKKWEGGEGWSEWPKEAGQTRHICFESYLSAKREAKTVIGSFRIKTDEVKQFRKERNLPNIFFLSKNTNSTRIEFNQPTFILGTKPFLIRNELLSMRSINEHSSL